MDYYDIPSVEEVRTLAWLHDKDERRPCSPSLTQKALVPFMVSVGEARAALKAEWAGVAGWHFSRRYPCSVNTLERAQDYSGDVNWINLAHGMIVHYACTGEWLGGYRGIHLMQLCDDRVLAAIELAEPRLSFVM